MWQLNEADRVSDNDVDEIIQQYGQYIDETVVPRYSEYTNLRHKAKARQITSRVLPVSNIKNIKCSASTAGWTGLESGYLTTLYSCDDCQRRDYCRVLWRARIYRCSVRGRGHHQPIRGEDAVRAWGEASTKWEQWGEAARRSKHNEVRRGLTEARRVSTEARKWGESTQWSVSKARNCINRSNYCSTFISGLYIKQLHHPLPVSVGLSTLAKINY